MILAYVLAPGLFFRSLFRHYIISTWMIIVMATFVAIAIDGMVRNHRHHHQTRTMHLLAMRVSDTCPYYTF